MGSVYFHIVLFCSSDMHETQSMYQHMTQTSRESIDDQAVPSLCSLASMPGESESEFLSKWWP